MLDDHAGADHATADDTTVVPAWNHGLGQPLSEFPFGTQPIFGGLVLEIE